MTSKLAESASRSAPGGRTPRYFLVLPAAGSGRRMHNSVPKQYLQVDGKSLLQLTLERLGSMPWFTTIVVVLAASDTRWPAVAARLEQGLQKKILLAPGGAERFQSVGNALAVLQSAAHAGDWILVHDAVRPCIHEEDIRRLMSALQDERAGGLLAAPVRETVKESTPVKNGAPYVQRTLDRSALWLAATPQMFRYAVLQEALQHVLERQLPVTDEASAVELLGLPVRLVTGRPDNLKVTWPEDLLLVSALLRAQAQSSVSTA